MTRRGTVKGRGGEMYNLKELSSFIRSSQTGIQQELVGLTTDRRTLVCMCVCVWCECEG